MNASSGPGERVCLVTVGATVGFPSLIAIVLSPAFWAFLVEKGFTSLRVQCGPDIARASKHLERSRDLTPGGLSVDVFESRRNLMKEEMVLCKARQGERRQGLVISHAGTGTILDAWKIGVPLIVVPNAHLLDNHQAQMADHLAKEGYATQSTADLDNLKGAVDKAELLSQENKSRWPAHSVGSRPGVMPAQSLWTIAPEEIVKEEHAQMAND